jgi:hypothetical protein
MLPDPRNLRPASAATANYENLLVQRLLPNGIISAPVAVCKPFVNVTPVPDADNFIKYDVPRPTCSASTSGGSSTSNEDVSQYCFASKLSPEELAVLEHTNRFLDQCQFFYPDDSKEDARRRLADPPPGTFLLRPTSDPNFFLSLSVKTSRGTTSVRVAFRAKKFSLDSDPQMRQPLPAFDSVPALITSYRRLADSVHKNRVVFLEASGRKDTPIILKSPLLKAVASLKHLSRVSIMRAVHPRVNQLHLLPGASTWTTDFLLDYPHPV